MSGPLQYLLDTHVLSETRRKQADATVMGFLAAAEPSALWISVLSVGELRKGVSLKAKSDPQAGSTLAGWVDGLEFSFADRILGIDTGIATLWGELSAERARPVVDTLLAATALKHGLTLVTRNVDHVRDTGVTVLNPWSDSR